MLSLNLRTDSEAKLSFWTDVFKWFKATAILIIRKFDHFTNDKWVYVPLLITAAVKKLYAYVFLSGYTSTYVYMYIHIY